MKSKVVKLIGWDRLPLGRSRIPPMLFEACKSYLIETGHVALSSAWGSFCRMETTFWIWFTVVLTVAFHLGQAEHEKKAGGLRIGIKQRVDPKDCLIKAKKGDTLSMHYTVSTVSKVEFSSAIWFAFQFFENDQAKQQNEHHSFLQNVTSTFFLGCCREHWKMGTSSTAALTGEIHSSSLWAPGKSSRAGTKACSACALARKGNWSFHLIWVTATGVLAPKFQVSSCQRFIESWHRVEVVLASFLFRAWFCWAITVKLT